MEKINLIEQLVLELQEERNKTLNTEKHASTKWKRAQSDANILYAMQRLVEELLTTQQENDKDV